MGEQEQELHGPDLALGIGLDQLTEDVPFPGHAQGENLILIRKKQEVFAVAASCSHYHGPLAEGLVVGETVRCPWHHACFDLRTGAASGPGLDAIACYRVERDGAQIRVGPRLTPPVPAVHPTPARVVVIGAGAAGAACVEALRNHGHSGSITLVGAEAPGPVDRPNLSKDFLAGAASEDWVPLRWPDFYEGLKVELIAVDPVVSIDAQRLQVKLTSGRELSADAILIATGAEPVRVPIPGATLPHVFVLRTLADAKAIIAAAEGKKRAVVVGSSFIGLEAAASLTQRGLAVEVVSRDAVPLQRILGEELGGFIRGVHEKKGTRFTLGVEPRAITPDAVELLSGQSLPAELVVMGVGVRPRVALAQAAGLAVDQGVVVDAHFLTSAPGIYAAGDVAQFPRGGRRARIEHWQVAQRQGAAAAKAMLGRPAPYRDVPYFWSQHHDVTLAYVGHAERWDRTERRGDLESGDAAVAYWENGQITAVVTLGRDSLSLAIEAAMEAGDQARVERLFKES